MYFVFFFQAEDGIRDIGVTGVQTCALPIFGYGNANYFEGAGAAPTLSSTRSANRKGGGSIDTDNNNLDFTAAAPTPRNRAGEGSGDQEPVPGEPSRIHDVQGPGHISDRKSVV